MAPASGIFSRQCYTCVTWRNRRVEIAARPVQFARVKPGETLLKENVAA